MMEKEAQQKTESINDAIHTAKEKSKADSSYYHVTKQAEANSLLLTKEYLELKKYEYLANNTKIYYGNSIPNMFLSVTGDKTKSPLP